jgi:hypothetical protein
MPEATRPTDWIAIVISLAALGVGVWERIATRRELRQQAEQTRRDLEAQEKWARLQMERQEYRSLLDNFLLPLASAIARSLKGVTYLKRGHESEIHRLEYYPDRLRALFEGLQKDRKIAWRVEINSSSIRSWLHCEPLEIAPRAAGTAGGARGERGALEAGARQRTLRPGRRSVRLARAGVTNLGAHRLPGSQRLPHAVPRLRFPHTWTSTRPAYVLEVEPPSPETTRPRRPGLPARQRRLRCRRPWRDGALRGARERPRASRDLGRDPLP